MKNTATLFTAILLMLLCFISGAQETWSFQQCVDYAMDNNILVKQQELNTQYTENALNQARSDRLPSLNGSLSNSLNYGRSLTYDNTYQNVNSSQINGYLASDITLWKGSVLTNSIRQRELDLQAAVHDMQKTKDDMVLNIAASYLEILFAAELVGITGSQIDVTKQQIERTRKLVDAGSLARGALLEMEAQLAREELQLVKDQNREQLAYLNLYQLLELPVEKSFRIEIPRLPEIRANLTMINSFDIFERAIQVRPEISAARLRVESARRQLDVAKGTRLPELSFGANYYNLYNDKYTDLTGEPIDFGEQLSNNQRFAMGFSLNIPLFNRFRVKNDISNASLQIADYAYRLQSARNALRKDIEQAYSNALAALNSYISSEKAVQSAEEAFRYTEEKFNVGMINTVEYNQSKNYLTVARSELLQAKYEFIFRAKILDFYQGIPIEL